MFLIFVLNVKGQYLNEMSINFVHTFLDSVHKPFKGLNLMALLWENKYLSKSSDVH